MVAVYLDVLILFTFRFCRFSVSLSDGIRQFVIIKA